MKIAYTLALSLLLSIVLVLPTFSENVLTIQKTPFESFNCGTDFTQVIGSGGVTLVSVTATQNGQNVTSAIISASPAPFVVGTSDVVMFRVQGGSLRLTYQISVKVQNTTTGEQFEGITNLVISAQ